MSGLADDVTTGPDEHVEVVDELVVLPGAPQDLAQGREGEGAHLDARPPEPLGDAVVQGTWVATGRKITHADLG
jgi:hypothetical protein